MPSGGEHIAEADRRGGLARAFERQCALEAQGLRTGDGAASEQEPDCQAGRASRGRGLIVPYTSRSREVLPGS